MTSTKSQHSEAKQLESMQSNPSAPPAPMEPPPSYNEYNSVADFDKDNPMSADHTPLVPSAYDCQQKQPLNFPSTSQPSHDKEHQPIVKQPASNSEKYVQSGNSKNERDRKSDNDDNCCSSFCNLCCLETCSCMVMCLEAFATSLQCVVACFMCTDLCQ